MRIPKYLKFLLVFLFLLAGYVCYTFYSTGYFRSIEEVGPFTKFQNIDLPGVEDIHADYEAGFVVLSSDDRARRRDGARRRGHLYLVDLADSLLVPKVLTKGFKRQFYPHGISMIKTSDSTHRIFAINHVRGQHSIEVFDLLEDALTWVKTLEDPSMISPNDLVALDAERFYFTNDHAYKTGFMRMVEDYAGLAISNVVYFDGEVYQEVADGIAFANGINFDRNRDLLFVASPRGFLVKVYQVGSDGTLDFVEDIPCRTGVDNITLDPQGKLWIGCHPNLLHYTAYAAGRKEISPSEIITIDYRGKRDYSLSSIYVNQGEDVSGSTVAVPIEDMVFVGNVMDDHFLILKEQE